MPQEERMARMGAATRTMAPRGAHPEGTRSLDRLAWWTLIAYFLVFASYVVAVPEDVPLRKETLDVGQVVTPVVGAVLCALAGLRAADSRRLRWSWWFLAVALGTSAFAEALWGYYEIVQRQDLPSPSLADAAWGVYYPLAFVALLLQTPSAETKLGRVTSSLDALLITLGAAALSWQFFLGPALSASTDPLLALVSVSYPLGDLILILALASLMLRLPAKRVPLHCALLLGSFVTTILADTVFGVLVIGGDYETGNWIDPLWVAGYALAGLAALSFGRSGWSQTSQTGISSVNLSWTRFVRLLLPYVALPLVVLFLFQTHANGQEEAAPSSEILLAIAFAIVGLTLVRQFLVLLENNRLNLSLAVFSKDLEAKVAHRTEELFQRSEQLAERSAQLDALNRVATQISLCLTPSEVQSVGLRLACAATGWGSGAMWLRSPEGKVSLVAAHGMPEETRAVLGALPERSPAFKEGPAWQGLVEVQWSDVEDEPAAVEGGSSSSRSLLLVALTSRQLTLGVLGLVRTGGHAPTDSERNVCQAIGASLGIALENANHYEELRQLADRDPVTNLLNHRAVHRRIEEELKRAERNGREFSVVMADLDNFKLFNDTYGHQAGDQVLRDVASLLTRCVREFDILARYGGDEYLVVLPEAGRGQARIVAERLQQELSGQPFAAADGSRVPIQMSFGLATYPHDASGCNQLVGCADANMYVSKQQGGNVITSGDDGLEQQDVPKLGTFGILDALITAVDNKDHYTRRHSENVTVYATAMAHKLGLSDETQRTMRIAGLLHDVGKIGVPDRVLRKPGRLTEEEFAIIKQHVTLGEMIIKDVPNLPEVLEAVGAHHERFDGKGYPRGLQGGDIPMLGRILAVADAYSAMVTDRPYRKGLSIEEARRELSRVAGTQLDQQLVRVFLELLEERATETESSGAISAVAGAYIKSA